MRSATPVSVGPPKRVVVLGAGGPHRTEAAIARAVRALGHRCRRIDVPTRCRRLGRWAAPLLRWQVDRLEPDALVLTRYAADLDDAALRLLVRGRAASVWFFDIVDRPHPAVLRLARAAGSLFVTCPSQVELYRRAGIPQVHFLPQGVDPGLDRPAAWAPPRYRCDVSFVGSGQYPHRHALLRALAAAAGLQIRGPGWKDAPADLPVVGGPVRGRRFARVVRGAAISLGANATPQQDREPACTSNRLWKVLGCGGFYLGPRVPQVELLARGGEHCVWYDSVDDAVALARHYLADPAARRSIARAGRAHALTAHTYAHRVARLLEGCGYPL